MNRFLNTKTIILLLMVALAASFRIFTDNVGFIPNVSPIAALALITGAFYGKKAFAVAAPLIAMFISDLFIGFHDAMPAVYLSFALAILAGYIILSKKTSVVRVIGASFIASSIFFVISNFWVWAAWSYYTYDISGLVLCYESALPFFRNALIGDLVFNGAFFGFFAYAEKYIAAFGGFRTMPLLSSK